MLSAGPFALGIPLPHRDYMAAARRLAITGDGSGKVCIQARRHSRDGAYRLCGEVRELGAGDVERFRVRTAIDEWWARGRDLRLCSPDGRCSFNAIGPALEPTTDPARSTAGATTNKTQQPCGIQRGCDVQPTGHPTP